ncbi:MAG: ATP-dependent 6-phosphofructokinase [Spirochaetia bacterium]
MTEDRRNLELGLAGIDNLDFTIEKLGKATHESPFLYSSVYGDKRANFVPDTDKVLFDTRYDASVSPEQNGNFLASSNLMEKAGPRQKLYFDPARVNAGICTCGGLCPGLNDVIRSVVRSLMLGYKVKNVWGFRYGFKGMLKLTPSPPMRLDTEIVDEIHKVGGSILGSARGGGEFPEEIVDTLVRYNINMLFVIGGDGTQKGAHRIAETAQKRGYEIAVVGIPKTIDNDLMFIQKSFGFETAVEKAQESVVTAHTEAKGAHNGVGLVKLMGRDSGFIAAQTALASHEANFVLIPEVPFQLEGENGLLKLLEKRLARKGHAVIVVAEGAGQDLIAKEHGGTDECDAGGNKKLLDIGHYLKEKMMTYFKSVGMDANVRYIDPSYIIRASAPIASDALYCARLGSNAVHAAMAGSTKMVISYWNGAFTHVPSSLVTSGRNTLNPESSLWRDVLESTLQPVIIGNE